jgi:hypothetical protein
MPYQTANSGGRPGMSAMAVVLIPISVATGPISGSGQKYRSDGARLCILKSAPICRWHNDVTRFHCFPRQKKAGDSDVRPAVGSLEPQPRPPHRKPEPLVSPHPLQKAQ